MVSEPGSDEVYNLGRRAWRYVKREWPKVKAVKGPFFGVLAVGLLAAGGASWLLARGIYTSEIEGLQREKGSLVTTIESLKGTITQQREYLEQLRYQTQSGTNPEAIKKIQELQNELHKLRSDTDATVDFLGPDSVQKIGGSYIVKGKIQINATTPKSGLTFGFTTTQFQDFKIIAATDLPVICGPYKSPKLAELGAHRFHCRNVNGAYWFELKIGVAGPIAIRHQLEGKQEGKVVTWQIP